MAEKKNNRSEELPLKAIEILNFWFGPSYWKPLAADVAMGRVYDQLWTSRWFAKEELQAPVDDFLRGNFAEDVERAIAGEYNGWTATANGTLALIILLDQISRNIYRGKASAFAQDPQALQMCLDGLDSVDQQLRPIARTQFYMPLVHAESLELQTEAVRRFEALVPEARPGERFVFERWVQVAYRHHWVISVFGRYPERNAIIGRQHTEEERAYLNTTYQPPK